MIVISFLLENDLSHKARLKLKLLLHLQVNTNNKKYKQ